MEAITAGEVKVKELSEYRVTKCDISQEYNRHAVACLTLVSDNIHTNDRILQVLENGVINIFYKDEYTFFSGKIKELKCGEIGNLYEIEIIAVSHSINLDIEKKSRSFQNVAITYRELAEMVVSEISNTVVICSADCDVPLDRIYIQYNETDWEFLKRVFSQIGLSFYCDVSKKETIIYIGVEDRTIDVDFQESKYVCGMALSHIKHGNAMGYGKEDFLYYDIVSYGNFELGTQVEYKEKLLRIYSKKTYFEDDILNIQYRLFEKGGFVTVPVYNEQLSGMSLVGKVIKTENESIKIHLEIDKEQKEEEAYSFEWTPLSGNMMYCMPMKNTKVALYLSGRDESSAKAIACVGEGQESISGGRGSSYRAFTTEHDKKMELLQDGISFSSNKDGEPLAKVDLNDESGISFFSKKDICIIDAKEIKMESDETIEMSAVTEVKLIQTGTPVCGESIDQAEARIELQGNTEMCGTTGVEENPTERIVCAKFKDEPVEGEFSWGELGLNVLAGIAVAVAVAAFVAFVVTTGGMAVFAAGAIGGTIAVLSLAVADISSGNNSSLGRYCLKGGVNAMIGALTNSLGITAVSGKTLSYIGKNFLAGMGMSALGNLTEQTLENRIWGDEFSFWEFCESSLMGGIFSAIFAGAGCLFRGALAKGKYQGSGSKIIQDLTGKQKGQYVDKVNQVVAEYNGSVPKNEKITNFGKGKTHRKKMYDWLEKHLWELYKVEHGNVDNYIGVSEGAGASIGAETRGHVKQNNKKKESSTKLAKKYIEQYGY